VGQRAVVVGAEVIGVCAAYYLAGAGWQVTILEQGRVCAGCSYGNGGAIVPSHSVPLAAPGVWQQALRWLFNSKSPFRISPRFDPSLLAWLWRFRQAGQALLQQGFRCICYWGDIFLYRESLAIGITALRQDAHDQSS
jgi:D-amino-acid dehydrogenase